MLILLRYFVRSQSGFTMIQYAFIGAIAALAIMMGMTSGGS